MDMPFPGAPLDLLVRLVEIEQFGFGIVQRIDEYDKIRICFHDELPENQQTELGIVTAHAKVEHFEGDVACLFMVPIE